VDGPEATERVAIINPRIVYEPANWQNYDVPPFVAGTVDDPKTAGQVLDLALRFCPSPYQAQRIAKKIADERNQGWRGNVRTKLTGLRAYGQSTISISLSEIPSISGRVFEIINVALDPSAMTVLIGVREMTPSAWDWPAGSGTVVGPLPPIAQTTFPVSPPSSVTAHANSNHSITINWTNDGTVISNQVQYRTTTGPGLWNEDDPPAGANTQTSPILTAGTQYDVQVRSVGFGGTVSQWIIVTAITA
jgi:hypothetical protein